MNTEEYGRIIAKNLKRLAYENRKSQVEIARDLGINKSTLSGWMNGTRVPKMSKIDMLCTYFGCERSDIMEPEGAPKKEAVTEAQAELVRIVLRARPENVALLLDIAKRLEGAP